MDSSTTTSTTLLHQYLQQSGSETGSSTKVVTTSIQIPSLRSSGQITSISHAPTSSLSAGASTSICDSVSAESRRENRTSDLRIHCSHGIPLMHNNASGEWQVSDFVADQYAPNYYVTSVKTKTPFEFAVEIRVDGNSRWINRDGIAYQNFTFPQGGGVFELKGIRDSDICKDEEGLSVLNVFTRRVFSLMCHLTSVSERMMSVFTGFAKITNHEHPGDDAMNALLHCLRTKGSDIVVLYGGVLSRKLPKIFYSPLEDELFKLHWDVMPTSRSQHIGNATERPSPSFSVPTAEIRQNGGAVVDVGKQRVDNTADLSCVPLTQPTADMTSEEYLTQTKK